MTRRNKILRNIAILIGLVLVTGIVATQIVQTTWFRNYVRQKIITATEDATGGRVEVGAFSFDWTHLQATIANFVIHGTEPPASAPLVRVTRVQVNLQLFTSFKRIVNVSYLGLERPEVNVMVSADGRTNIPSPRLQTNSTSSPLETVVNLAVGRFESSNGFVRFDSRVQPLNIQANNLTVQLAYNLLKQSYQGDITLQPVYVISGRSTPVVFSLHLPVTLARDRISLTNATITTPASALTITGSLENMKNPKTSAQITGQLSVADLNQLGGLNLAPDAWGPRSSVSIDADAVIANDTIQISKIQVKGGSSLAQASGTLKDPQGRGSMDFTTAVNLPEMMRLVRSDQRLSGTVQMDGNAKLDQQLLQVNRFHLRAFGAELTGDATLEAFKRYQVSGQLTGVNLQATQRMLGMKPLPYDGVLAGRVQAQGSVDGSPSASADLKITPGRGGIPLSGQINAAYNGATSEIRASNSYVALPHSRVNFNGSIREGIHIDLTSTDLHDLLAAADNSNPSPVKLNGGEARVTSVVTGTLSDPRISGHLTANRLILEDRQFDSLASDFSASKSQVSVQSASLNRAAMEAIFNGSVGLTNWTLTPSNSLAIAASLRNGDLADILVLATQPSVGYSGALTATATLNGTVGNPTGSINLEAANGTIANERFDHIQAQVLLAGQQITIPTAFVTQGDARVDLSAEYQHARDSLTTGTLNARVRSNQVDLSRVRAVQSPVQNMAGLITLNASVAGNIAETPNPDSKTSFLLTNLQADLTARGLKLNDETLGDLTANATTSGQTVNYVVSSDFAGSQIKADGHTQLATDYPTSLDANIANLPVERVLALLKRTDIPAKGQLAGTAHLTGTISNPQGDADINLTKAVLYDEPLDSLRARVSYAPSTIEMTQFEAVAGPTRLVFTGRYDHPISDLRQGDLQFHLEDTRIDLARIRNIQKMRAGLRGNVRVSADSRASIQPGGRRVNLKELTAQLDATGLAAEGRNLGDLNLSANTSAGKVNFKLDSNLANSSIHGQGTAGLTSDYPVDAQVSFNDLTWANLEPLVSAAPASPFDVATSGLLTVKGPAANVNQLNASLHVTSLQAHPVRPPGGTGTGTNLNTALVLQNQGDIAVSLSNGMVRIDSAHLSGPQTDITASGTASTRDNTLNLKVNANANLALLKTLNADVFSSGTVAVNASVAGTASKPQVAGRAELRNASISYADLPAGIENANGVVVFNGNTATIQTLTGESGSEE
jgi:translocation and assembly module TamB